MQVNNPNYKSQYLYQEIYNNHEKSNSVLYPHYINFMQK
jgi:hypothetical protein